MLFWLTICTEKGLVVALCVQSRDLSYKFLQKRASAQKPLVFNYSILPIDSPFYFPMMIRCLPFLFALVSFLTVQTFAQQHIYVNANANSELPVVNISENVSFPDIKVLLARDISFEDITVGITNNRHQADIILTRREIDAGLAVRVDNTEAFPDLRILYSHDLAFPDVRIEFRDDNRPVDYLIYTEKTTVSEQELIACLLPLIQEKARN